MKKSGKVLVGVAGLAGLGALVYNATKTKAATPPGAGATLSLRIVPATRLAGRYGRSYPALSPTQLVEGSIGNQLQATVTNTSVYTGTSIKAPYTFDVYVFIQVNGVMLLQATQVVPLAASAVQTLSWSFNIPYGAGATGAGSVYAELFDDPLTHAPSPSGMPPTWAKGTARPVPPNGKGDVDMNGLVSSADVTAVQNIILGIGSWTSAQLAAADANGDGVVNQGDTLLINSYYAGVVDNLGRALFTPSNLNFTVTPATITPGGTLGF
jgi:hypothetical protein